MITLTMMSTTLPYRDKQPIFWYGDILHIASAFKITRQKSNRYDDEHALLYAVDMDAIFISL